MRGSLAALAVVATLCSVARADDDRPWAAGVSDADQQAALDEFQQGNDLFAQGKLAQAEDHYKAAIARWDHPSIDFNLAVVLIRLHDPIDAYAHLLASLRFGDAPFERPELYQQALDYQSLLEGQLSKVTISCTLAGTHVTLDGAPLLDDAGAVQQVLTPGSHEVVATHDGYATTVRTLVLMPGATTAEDVTPVPVRAVPTHLVRRWPAWQPWAVAGAGAVALIVGTTVEIQASSEIKDYDAEVAQACARGCVSGDLPASTRALLTSGRRDNVIGVATLGAGAAIAAVGVWMVVVNQPHAVTLEAAPTTGGAMFGLAGRF